MLTQKRRTYLPLLFCFATAAVYLLFCSKSSPLYPMNDWVDVNCFFTMGRSLLEGKMPYLDLYEQKGPVLYLVYALIALVSPGSYLGVYLLEVVCYGLFLYFSGKCVQVFLGETLLVWFLVAVEGALIGITHAFAHGASVEEMSLFMSAYGLLAVLRSGKENRALSFREAFLCGLFSGILLWVKYTMLGFFLGLAVYVILWYLGWGLGWKQLFQTIGAFFAGLGTVTGLVILWFLLAGALDDLFTVYFYNNIFLYPKEAEVSRWETIGICLRSTLRLNSAYTWMILAGLFWAAVHSVRDCRPLLLMGLTFFALALGTYWGGWGISYYGLVFAVFSIFGIIALGQVLRFTGINRLLAKLTFGSRAAAWLWLTVVVALMANIALTCGKNTYLLGTPKEELPQYRFAKIIKQEEDPTLLNYGFLDGGFYYAADITPNCYFFCQLNVVTEDSFRIPRECINNAQVDFIVTRDRTLESYPNLKAELYECVDTAEFFFEGKMRTYYLYRLVES